MSVQRIATRYAKSLIDLASETNKLEEVKADMDTFKAALGSRDLYLLLKSPIVPAPKKSAALKAVFEGKLSELTMAFLNILVTKGRESYLPEIGHAFNEQYKEIKHITTLKITTAEKMDAKSLEAIKAEFLKSNQTDDNVEIETAVDPSLIGGFVVEFANKMYDASVKHKLDTLKKEFVGNVYKSQIVAR